MTISKLTWKSVLLLLLSSSFEKDVVVVVVVGKLEEGVEIADINFIASIAIQLITISVVIATSGETNSKLVWAHSHRLINDDDHWRSSSSIHWIPC